MAIHDRLPIHRTASELLATVTRIHSQMQRGFKRTVGDKIVQHCADMLDLVALANADRQGRTAHIKAILSHNRAAVVWLRVAFDLKAVSPKLWSQAVPLLESVGKQANGWLKKSNEKAPAA